MSQYYSNKALLWDIDGTLSCSFDLGFQATQIVLKNRGYSPITASSYHEGTKFTTPTRFAWHVTNNPHDPIGIELGKEFDELYVKQVSLETTKFYPGMTNLLANISQQFKGIKYGAVSNANHSYVEAVLKVNGVADDFPIQIGADDVASGKPHPQGLLECSRFFDIPPHRCIYIGDSPTDGQAASNAGMISIGVTWGSYTVDKISNHFTHIVNTVDELEATIIMLLDSL